MKYIITILLTFLIFTSPISLYSQEMGNADIPHKGIWITCFSEKKVLYSKQAVSDLVDFCRKSKIDEIYLQIYRADQAYYDSNVTDTIRYDRMLKEAGCDTIDFLLEEIADTGIKVFAWINVLNITTNKSANIINKYGEDVLTRDQYLRPSMRTLMKDDSDKYYLRDEQLFLEPGDGKVQAYILSIVDEIFNRYPNLSGIHLDYVRYPYPVPYVPRSNFNKYGLTYGYGKANIERFKAVFGVDPLTMADENDNCLKWDNWKRKQVTELVGLIAKKVKGKSGKYLVSCAVMPSPETAYSVAFQEWPVWLERGLVDYVVLMNYTRDNDLTKQVIKSALAHRGNGKIYAGIGVFLMKNDVELFSEQYSMIEDLKPDGVVFFSYDYMTDDFVEIMQAFGGNY
jgi:uncharacterized lipoprotein YddW (UPF0748 family)